MSAPQDRHQMIAELLPVVDSLSELAGILGRHPKTIRPDVMAVRIQMEADGTHPLCPCGRLKFHHGGCIHLGKAVTQERQAISPDRRDLVLALLREGLSHQTIATIASVSPPTSRKIRKLLSPADLAARLEIERARSQYHGFKDQNGSPSPAARRARRHLIADLIRQGHTYTDIARWFDMSQTAVRTAKSLLTPEDFERRTALDRAHSGHTGTTAAREMAVTA